MSKNKKCPKHPGRDCAPDRASCGECLEKARISAKRIRDSRKQHNVCPRCGKYPPALNKAYCSPCLDETRRNSRINYNECKSKGICPYHPKIKVRDGHTLCDGCIEEHNAYKLSPEKQAESRKRYFEKAKSLGKCANHLTNNCVEGKIFCKECLEDMSIRSKKRRERYTETNRCQNCGNSRDKHKSLCNDCWFKTIAYSSLGSRKYDKDIKFLLELQNYRCAISGRSLEIGINASIDHIIPTSIGGEDILSNLQWIDFKVNFMKSIFPVEQLLETCKKILQYSKSIKTKDSNFIPLIDLPCVCRKKIVPCLWHKLREASKRLHQDSSFIPILRDLYNSQLGLCALTGDTINLGIDASVDHIIPLSKGGSDDIHNLRWVTRRVNTIKYTMTDEELIKMCEDILQYN